VKTVAQELVELEAKLVFQVLRAFQASLANQELPVPQAPLVAQDLQVNEANKAIQVFLVNLALMVFTVLKATKVKLVLKVQLGNQVNKETMVAKVTKAQTEKLVLQVRPVLPVTMARPVLQVSQVLLVQWVQMVQKVKLAEKVPWVALVTKVSQVTLVLPVFLTLKEKSKPSALKSSKLNSTVLGRESWLTLNSKHQCKACQVQLVRTVNEVHLAPPALSDQKVSEAPQVFQASTASKARKAQEVKLVVSVLKVQTVKPDLADQDLKVNKETEVLQTLVNQVGKEIEVRQVNEALLVLKDQPVQQGLKPNVSHHSVLNDQILHHLKETLSVTSILTHSTVKFHTEKYTTTNQNLRGEFHLSRL
jgi:hypothetical protein